ncbi:MAG: fatty acid desaturase [Candidatus Paceibacterota bacterium]
MEKYSLIWWVILTVYVLVTTHLSSLSVSLYLHREYTHNAIALHPVVRSFFKFIIWFQTGMVPAEWVVVHKEHHQAPADGPNDPHSPRNEGKWRIVLFGVLYYTRAARKLRPQIQAELSARPDITSKRVIKHLGVFLNLLLNIFLFGSVGVFVWLIQSVWIPFWAAGIINGLGHSAHVAHAHTRDYSRNILDNGPSWVRVVLSIITAGESNHHNHHCKPSSPNFAFREENEFDWGYTVVRFLKRFGFASIR